jgi:hypothetical protein
MSHSNPDEAVAIASSVTTSSSKFGLVLRALRQRYDTAIWMLVSCKRAPQHWVNASGA